MFDNFSLCPALLRAVQELGYTEPTPIQLRAIPVIHEGRDLLAAAQTGTGKTLAFALPLLQRLQARAVAAGARAPRALVLVPTRELAAQVSEACRALAQHLPLRAALVFGGVSAKPQIEALRAGVDLVVATPGRLLDHMQTRTIDLSMIEMLVLDEGDRMLDMGFIRAIRRIIAALPQRRQTLLFSATFSEEVRTLARSLLREPLTIDIAPRNTPTELVDHRVYHVEAAAKQTLLLRLIVDEAVEQSLVFTRTKHGANRLAERLERDGLRCAAIHGNKSQGARTRALEDFKRVACGCWLQPTSPRAVWTSMSCRTWSISSCRTCPRTMCTASAAPGVRARAVAPSRWSAARSRSACGRSKSCWAIVFRWPPNAIVRGRMRIAMRGMLIADPLCAGSPSARMLNHHSGDHHAE